MRCALEQLRACWKSSQAWRYAGFDRDEALCGALAAPDLFQGDVVF